MPEVIKKKVLVVDDEKDVREFLRAALIEAGFDVIQAEDGNIALEEVKNGNLDIYYYRISPDRLKQDEANKELLSPVYRGNGRQVRGRNDFS